MSSWEETFQAWAGPPSDTQQQKADNAERAVRGAISSANSLKAKVVTVRAQGSYANRTNVRMESDVDICVLYTDSVFFDLPDGMTAADVGLSVPAAYGYSDYKNHVEQALVDRFGRMSVARGKKTFDVHENTYRIDADVVACFEYRRYQQDGRYLVGTAFNPDSGSRIINRPVQNYENGLAKNKATGRRFKAVVRILKRLRNKMADEGFAAASPIPSFLLECLTWNVPNEGFGHTTYSDDVRWAIAHLWNNTRKNEDCSEWGEINELKYSFRPAQPWTRETVNAFLQAAWDYVGFK